MGAQFRLTVPRHRRRSDRVLAAAAGAPRPGAPRSAHRGGHGGHPAAGAGRRAEPSTSPARTRRLVAVRCRRGRPMRRTPLLLAVVFLLLGLVTGCVSVPTSGPVEKVEGQPPECQNCINVDVAPPSAGDEPKQIVQGFLRATSNFQPNYAVARQFLTTGAAEKWAPESGVSIYSGSLQAAGTTVILDGRLVGSLGPDRTYTAQDKAWRVNFGMVKENGEWRISTPPPGLMVAEFAFSSFYQSYNLYFVGNGSCPGAEPDLPAEPAQPGEHRVGADAGPAERAVGLARPGGDQRHPGGHRPQRRRGDDHRRRRRGRAQRQRAQPERRPADADGGSGALHAPAHRHPGRHVHREPAAVRHPGRRPGHLRGDPRLAVRGLRPDPARASWTPSTPPATTRCR